MHRVCWEPGILDVDPHGGVVAEVEHVPLRLVGGGAGLGKEENRVVVVCAEGGTVHCPDPVLGGVLPEADLDCTGCGGRGGGGD